AMPRNRAPKTRPCCWRACGTADRLRPAARETRRTVTAAMSMRRRPAEGSAMRVQAKADQQQHGQQGADHLPESQRIAFMQGELAWQHRDAAVHATFQLHRELQHIAEA